MSWCHLCFEAYCSHGWDCNPEFWYKADPEYKGEGWLDNLVKVPNESYDPDKKQEPKPEYCPGNPCYTCHEEGCKFLALSPVDENEHDVMMKAWEDIPPSDEDDDS